MKKKRIVQFVSSSGVLWPWGRQLPSHENIWADTSYLFSEQVDVRPDWLVVYDGWTSAELMTAVPRERRVLVCPEPQSFHRYQPAFLNQFAHVLTTQNGVRHPGVIRTQVAINWFVGVRFNGAGPHEALLSFKDFEGAVPDKTRLCSVVCSTKAVTRGHRQRLAFVERLKQELGDRIDIFGRGFQEVADKDEALASYRFHIALENSSHPDYWTEKIADPFLRGCFPIYAGCPNLGDYFPSGSYAQIDLDRPDEAIASIKAILGSDIDKARVGELHEAKRRVLWEHNIFSVLERIYTRLEAGEVNAVAPGLSNPERLMTDHESKDLKMSRRLMRLIRRALGMTPRSAQKS